MMKIRATLLPVLAILAGFIPSARADDLKFDQVTLVEGKAPDVSLLYVVLTEPKADAGKLAELVVKYARPALEQAALHKFKGATKDGERYKYEGNVVFLVRNAPKDREGHATGFTVEQLKEIIDAKPADALRLAGRHAWSLSDKVPEKK